MHDCVLLFKEFMDRVSVAGPKVSYDFEGVAVVAFIMIGQISTSVLWTVGSQGAECYQGRTTIQSCQLYGLIAVVQTVETHLSL
jgi:hypothetical protein